MPSIKTYVQCLSSNLTKNEISECEKNYAFKLHNKRPKNNVNLSIWTGNWVLSFADSDYPIKLARMCPLSYIIKILDAAYKDIGI